MSLVLKNIVELNTKFDNIRKEGVEMTPLCLNKENVMKGLEHNKNEKKKAKLTLKEKRLQKREKKAKFKGIHEVQDVHTEFDS